MERFYVWEDPCDYTVSVRCNSAFDYNNDGQFNGSYTLYRIDWGEKAQADAIAECKEWLDNFVNKIGATVIDNESHYKNQCEMN